MLKISAESLSTGIRIRLPEDWHDKVLSAANPSDYYPYDYVVDEIVKDKREFYYICKPEKKFKVVASKIVLSGYALQYLLAEELEDSNTGLLFKDYFPEEDSKILITNISMNSLFFSHIDKNNFNAFNFLFSFKYNDITKQ